MWILNIELIGSNWVVLLDDHKRVISKVEIGVERINEWTWVEAKYYNSEPTVIEAGLIKWDNVLRKRKKVVTDASMVCSIIENWYGSKQESVGILLVFMKAVRVHQEMEECSLLEKRGNASMLHQCHWQPYGLFEPMGSNLLPNISSIEDVEQW